MGAEAMSEAKVLTGGCQCGAIRYAVKGELDNPSICHCRMCQKAFGSFFAPLVGTPVPDFEVTRGTLSIFRSSDAVERGFCANCGTPLTFHYVGSDRIDVSMGSLDDPAAVPPIVQFGIESRMPWFEQLASLRELRTEDDTDEKRLHLIGSSNHQHPDHDTEAGEWPKQRAR